MYKPWPGDTPRDRFVDQFEPDGDGYLYRYRNVGPARRVTEDEMDDFVSAFDRWQTWSSSIGFLAVSGLVIVSFWQPFGLPRAGGWWPLLGYGSVVLLFRVWNRASTFLAFRAPMRALADRPPMAASLPRIERRRLALDRTSEKDLIGLGVFAAGMLSFLILTTGWPTKPMALALTTVCIAMLTWALVQSARKWWWASPAQCLTPPAS